MIQTLNDKLSKEFASPKLNPIARAITLLLAWYVWENFGKVLYITSIYRPEGNHSSWRMVDGDNDSLTQEQKKEAEAAINEMFIYDPQRPHLKVCWLHSVSDNPDTPDIVEGDHFHIQVHARTTIRA